ncbi:MAG: recombinase family protein [Acidobacteria bacterium]|nr:recombinase family protein [Acidobacteriota bacterium]
MSQSTAVTADHLRRRAYLYVRQSSLQQVHQHQESTARQYALKQRALGLGWAAERIVVVDDDQGVSGASAAERTGFQRIVADVGLGRVGMVMGLEVSRLARNSSDWHRLLEICALSETLILDEDGLYDPAHFNDRLLLGMKGTFSEAELHVLRARLTGGLLNKARRGELWIRPPLGYVADPAGKLMLDPDEQVQGAVRLVFETFARAGSAYAVVRYFREQALAWPRRVLQGPHAGTLVFGALRLYHVLGLLHNPRYTGAYVYGRTRQRKLRLAGQARFRRLPREEWKVFLPDAHPGYISWEQFEANQATLRDNAHRGGAQRRSAPREGVALLQGLVICGRCGERMTVHYFVSGGRLKPRYCCQRRAVERSQPPCQSLPGAAIDHAVSELVLETLTPAAIDIAVEVFDELRARAAEVDRAKRAQIARLREEAELAQRQFLLVRPENRLVADNLERHWNEALQRLAAAEEAYAGAARTQTPPITPEMNERVAALVADLPRVWHDPRTPARDRKRMLRLLIEDVTLLRDDGVIRVSIRWRGGATRQVECPQPLASPDLRRTPAAVVEQARVLATGQTDAQIADTLNGRRLRTGTGLPFSRPRVRSLREAYNIDSYAEHLTQAGWLTAPQMAKLLDVHPETAKRFARQGMLHAVRADDKGTVLFEPPTEPLPAAHPGKWLRDRRQHPKLVSQVQEGA